MVARLAKKANEVRTMASHVRHDPPTVLELQYNGMGREDHGCEMSRQHAAMDLRHQQERILYK